MIPLGILLPVSTSLPAEVQRCAAEGFESVSFFLWEHNPVADLPGTLSRACDAAQAAGLRVSTFSVYGNPLRDDQTGDEIRSLWPALVAEAQRLRVPLVTGFAGRVVGASVEDSLPAWKRFFSPLADHAAAQGVQLAFENCRIGDTWKTGKWNIAINPDAWEAMFTTLEAPNLGLEWEPCHQLEALADPHRQLEIWAHKVLHVHGKDAHVDAAALAARGFFSRGKWHRSVLPGQGGSDWRRLLATLAASDYQGTVDIENPATAEQDVDQRRSEEIKSLNYMKLSR